MILVVSCIEVLLFAAIFIFVAVFDSKYYEKIEVPNSKKTLWFLAFLAFACYWHGMTMIAGHKPMGNFLLLHWLYIMCATIALFKLNRWFFGLKMQYKRQKFVAQILLGTSFTLLLIAATLLYFCFPVTLN